MPQPPADIITVSKDRSWTDVCTEGMTSYRLPVPALLPELLTLPMELELREPAGEPIAEAKV